MEFKVWEIRGRNKYYGKIIANAKGSTDHYIVYIVEYKGKLTIYDTYYADVIYLPQYEKIVKEIFDEELGDYKIEKICFAGFSGITHYCTSDTKIDETYDLGMKYLDQWDGIMYPQGDVYIPESFAKKHNMKSVLQKTMQRFADKKLPCSWQIKVVKEESYKTKNEEEILLEDRTASYTTGVNDDLSIDEIQE